MDPNTLPEDLPFLSPGGFEQRAYVPGVIHPVFADGSLVVDTPWGEPKTIPPGAFSSVIVPGCAAKQLKEALVALQEDVDEVFSQLTQAVIQSGNGHQKPE